MKQIKREEIAENKDRCFVCGQGRLGRAAIDKMFLDGVNLHCRYCGAIHGAVQDGEGFQIIQVKGVKIT